MNYIRIRSFLMFIFFASCTLLTAQRKPYDTEVYWGVNGGMTGSMVMFKPTVSQSFLTGYNGGLVFRYINAKSLGLQAELNYSERGWLEKDNNYSRRLNYIELPFMTHFNFGNKFRTFLNIGPKFSYLISENTLVNNVVGSTAPQHSQLVEHPFEYGLVAGTGFYLRMKRQVIQIEARASFSAIDIYSNALSAPFDNSNNVNASVNISWLIQTN